MSDLCIECYKRMEKENEELKNNIKDLKNIIKEHERKNNEFEQKLYVIDRICSKHSYCTQELSQIGDIFKMDYAEWVLRRVEFW